MNAASERMLTHFGFGDKDAATQTLLQPLAAVAFALADALDSQDPLVGAEVTTGLRKLVEAADCFARAQRYRAPTTAREERTHG
jgi:hypothetical protein